MTLRPTAGRAGASGRPRRNGTENRFVDIITRTTHYAILTMGGVLMMSTDLKIVARKLEGGRHRVVGERPIAAGLLQVVLA